MTAKTSIQAVLFDLDGTLVDTAPDFFFVVNSLLSEEGRSPLSYDCIRSTVSNGARALITLAFGLEPEAPAFPRLHQRLLDLYLQHLNRQHLNERFSNEFPLNKRTDLFPGLNRLLNWLEQQSIPWGIVTNKPERYTLPLLASLQLTSRCAAVICPDHVQQRKPDPESLLLACRQIGCDPEQTAYIGDHARDIEAGKRAQMHTASALYGYIPTGEDVSSWGSDFEARQPEQLLDWLQSL